MKNLRIGITLALVLTLVGGVWAQTATVEPRATELLNQARTAHGGDALANLRAYRERTRLEILGPNGQVQGELTQVSVYDFAGSRVRSEVYQGNTLVTITQVTPQGGQTWTQQSGTIRLPAAQTNELRAGLFQGWPGLRLGGTGREQASVTGPQTYQGVQGTEVRVRTQGAQTSYLFNANGVLVAEKLSSSQLGELTGIYEDYRAVSGIQIPFKGRLFAGPQLFARTETLEAVVNPTFNDETFRMP